MQIEQLDYILESLLFVSGDGLKISDICELLELQKSEITSSVKRLQKRYGGKCGIHLISFNGKIQFASNPDYADIISCVINPIKEKALSTPAMETLSIIAYRQPVTRLDIENIRGVNCDYALQALLKNDLIEIVGRKDSLGKPLLFGTTETFLKRFGIEDIESLPDRSALLDKIKEIEETSPTTEAEEHLYRFDENGETVVEGESGESVTEDPEVPDFLKDEKVEMITVDDADGSN